MQVVEEANGILCRLGSSHKATLGWYCKFRERYPDLKDEDKRNNKNVPHVFTTDDDDQPLSEQRLNKKIEAAVAKFLAELDASFEMTEPEKHSSGASCQLIKEGNETDIESSGNSQTASPTKRTQRRNKARHQTRVLRSGSGTILGELAMSVHLYIHTLCLDLFFV